MRFTSAIGKPAVAVVFHGDSLAGHVVVYAVDTVSLITTGTIGGATVTPVADTCAATWLIAWSMKQTDNFITAGTA